MDINPYQSPVTAIAADSEYYGIDTRKISFGEYYRIASNPVELVIFFLIKLLRVKLPQQYGFVPLELRRLSDAELPDQVNEVVTAHAEEAISLGFTDPVWNASNMIGSTSAVTGDLRDPEGKAILRISYTRCVHPRLIEDIQYAFVSWLEGGGVLVTSGMKRKLSGPENLESEYLPDRPMSEVLRRHRERIEGRAVEPVPDMQRMAELVHGLERESFEYHRRRGVFVPLPSHKVDQILQQIPTAVAVDTPAIRWLKRIEWMLVVLMLIGVLVSLLLPLNSRLLLVGIVGYLIIRLARWIASSN